MKRFIFFTVIFLCLSNSVQAKTIKVESLENFSTENPSSTYSVKVVDREEFKNGKVLEAGTIISGHVVRVQGPQRGKRNGYFEFIPASATYNGVTRTAQNPIVIARVVGYSPIDPKDLAIKAVKSAAGLTVKGASQGLSFVEGVAKAEEGSRLKSGLVNVYKDSPLSFLEPGSELEVKKGDILLLKIKKLRTKDLRACRRSGPIKRIAAQIIHIFVVNNPSCTCLTNVT